MGEGNIQGWELGTDICVRKNNELLYTILVKLSGPVLEYYIYEYDVLSEKVERLYSQYLLQPKRDGGKRKDIAFRWFNLNEFTEDDYKRKNNWKLLGFD